MFSLMLFLIFTEHPLTYSCLGPWYSCLHRYRKIILFPLGASKCFPLFLKQQRWCLRSSGE